MHTPPLQSLTVFNKDSHQNSYKSCSFSVASKCAAYMVKNTPEDEDGERGVIINVASVAAFDGQVGSRARNLHLDCAVYRDLVLTLHP